MNPSIKTKNRFKVSKCYKNDKKTILADVNKRIKKTYQLVDELILEMEEIKAKMRRLYL